MKKDKRMKAIDDIANPKMLTVYMNVECTRCKRCVAHGGKCYGKVGITPCMGYEVI